MDNYRLKIFYVLLVLLMPNNLRACICMSSREAETNLERSSVVFIGILTQIVLSDSLYTTFSGSFKVRPYYNFKVLKYCKGLQGADYVSVFPDINSSCADGLKHVIIGDTILLFPFSISAEFLGVDQCTPFTILTNRALEIPNQAPNESELKLINDTTIWRYPALNNMIPKKIKIKPIQYNWRDIALVVSVILNFFFLILMIRRKSASVSNSQP